LTANHFFVVVFNKFLSLFTQPVKSRKMATILLCLVLLFHVNISVKFCWIFSCFMCQNETEDVDRVNEIMFNYPDNDPKTAYLDKLSIHIMPIILQYLDTTSQKNHP